MVEVKKVGTDGTKSTYSGYVIVDGLVLTAGHGLALGDAIRLRSASGGAWSDGSVVWRGGEHDAALVAGAGFTAPPVSLRWGRVEGKDPVEIWAQGFPAASGHDLTPLLGRAFPDGASRHGRMRVDVSGSIPRHIDGRPGWAGLSGATILDTADRVLGVLVSTPGDWHPGRLHAVPITALLADPDFQRLTGADPARLESIGDDCELIRPARERFEWDTDDVSLAELLKARYAIVPFVPDGRESALEDLTAWCRSEHPLAIRTLTGPAGTGKSRLAAELCRTLLEEPGTTAWHAGFAVDPVASAVSWGEWSPRRATLIVFDYAGDLVWRDPFRLLVTHLRELRRDERLRVPVRILLLSRQSPVDNLEDGSGSLHAMLRQAHNRELALPSLSLTPKARQDHLDTAFAAFTRPGSATAVRPDVDGPAYDRPLLVHIAALLGALGVSAPDPAESDLGTELLDQLIARENQRWRDRLDMPHDDHARQAVCLITLTAPSVAEARDLLRAIPAWADQPVANLDAAAKALFQLYPGSAYVPDTRSQRIAPVEPDLLAEHLIAGTVDLQEILARLQTHESATAAHHGRLLHIMDLTADHYPEIADDYRERRSESIRALLGELAGTDRPLPELLGGHLDLLTRAALEGIVQRREPASANLLASALEACRGEATVSRAAAGLQLALPYPHYQLARLGHAIELHRVDHLRAWLHSDRNTYTPRLATALNNLGLRLGDLDRPREALIPTREAVDLYRGLTAADPAQLPGLAAALNNLSLHLGDAERFRQALIAAEEAVGLYREPPSPTPMPSPASRRPSPTSAAAERTPGNCARPSPPPASPSPSTVNWPANTDRTCPHSPPP
ncbi:hypothetical protein Pen01_01610 [Phytomonospora endophytica]|nr:hypothetical protein Pen01_01610 [Phytomonospora endophytica]